MELVKNLTSNAILASGVTPANQVPQGRAYSVEFDQRRVTGGSGISIVNNGALFKPYSAEGVFDISDIYPVTLLNTGTIRAQIPEQSQCRGLFVIDSTGATIVEIHPSKYGDRSALSATGTVSTSGLAHIYVDSGARSSCKYRAFVQIDGSTLGDGDPQTPNLMTHAGAREGLPTGFTDVQISGSTTANPGATQQYFLTADPMPDGFVWEAALPTTVIPNPLSNPVSVTFPSDTGSTQSDTLFCVITEAGFQDPGLGQIDVTVSGNVTFRNLSINGARSVASGVSTDYTMNNVGPTPSAYAWTSNESSVVLTNGTSQTVSAVNNASGVYQLTCEITGPAINSPQSLGINITASGV